VRNVTVPRSRLLRWSSRLVLWRRSVVGRSLARPTASNQRVDGRLPPAHVPKDRWVQHVGLCSPAKIVRSSAAERADGRTARGARVVAA
jgi:hypothetical protein